MYILQFIFNFNFKDVNLTPYETDWKSHYEECYIGIWKSDIPRWLCLKANTHLNVVWRAHRGSWRYWSHPEISAKCPHEVWPWSTWYSKLKYCNILKQIIKRLKWFPAWINAFRKRKNRILSYSYRADLKDFTLFIFCWKGFSELLPELI